MSPVKSVESNELVESVESNELVESVEPDFISMYFTTVEFVDFSRIRRVS